MKFIRLSFALLTAMFALGSQAYAADGSYFMELERMYYIDDYHITDQFGTFRPDGSFRVKYSYTSPSFGIDVDPALWGRPILPLSSWEIIESSGLCPAWRRSRNVFYIGGEEYGTPYVIVAIKGHDANPTPVISEQPRSVRILEGWFTYFSVTAEPYSSLSYQWYFKNKKIPDETYESLFLFDVTPAQSGLYKVGLSTGGKTVFSKSAMLTVVKRVSITSGPKSQTVHSGKPATFRVAVKGTGPFTYQWYFNDEAITGATKSFYSIPHVKPESAGTYAVMVDNGLSYATSTNAVLTVVP